MALASICLRVASCMPSGCLDGRFVGAYGIFTSVKMDISRYISLIDIGDMWNLPLLIERKK